MTSLSSNWSSYRIDSLPSQYGHILQSISQVLTLFYNKESSGSPLPSVASIDLISNKFCSQQASKSTSVTFCAHNRFSDTLFISGRSKAIELWNMTNGQMSVSKQKQSRSSPLLIQHSSVIYNGYIFVYGGLAGQTVSRDLWSYSLRLSFLQDHYIKYYPLF